MSVEIDLFEGELTLIEGVGFFGASVFRDSLLLERANLRRGDPFQRKKVQDGILSVLSLYAERGYLDAKINPDIRINTESHRALVDFRISERIQSHIGVIRIENLKKTKRGVVTRELLFHEGEVARYSYLLQSQRRLYLTGLFQSAFIRPVTVADQDSTKKDIVIDLVENESVELNFYAGYGSVELGRTKMEFANNNLAGSVLGGTEDFWKLLWHLKNFRSMGSTVIASALEIGWMNYFGRSSAVPLNERFYLGGPSVLRGFSYRMVGPLDAKRNPLGGNFSIAVNLIEIRRAFYKMIGGVIFADAGQVWAEVDDVRISDFRFCVGIGARAGTPRGVLRCDYGINLDPTSSEPAGEIYFSVGQAF
ncbi:MAG: BamA/TamA family outer membrane protein [Candidatus Krumholzibacteriota bacterium]|nr:BamA/TamA family outer membrane protein [Candidatus Krumholzibacteriota bacterium]